MESYYGSMDLLLDAAGAAASAARMYFIMYILECLRAMHEKDEATRKKHQLEHLGGTFE